jgi:C-terminal processing protease CtpA/Prc
MSYSVCVSNQTAAAEMESAVKKMEDEGVQSYILDLRNNPVGLFLSQRVYMICNFDKKG